MKLFQSEFFLLTLIGGGFGVAYHDKLQVAPAVGGIIGVTAGVVVASLLALSITVGFILLTDKSLSGSGPVDKE
jgi:hypothetical protein